jgi:hypothetical protein
MGTLSPLAGLKINHDLSQGLPPLAISLPALRAWVDVNRPDPGMIAAPLTTFRARGDGV